MLKKNNPTISAGLTFFDFPISLVGFSGNWMIRFLVLQNWIVGSSGNWIKRDFHWIQKGMLDFLLNQK